jgi:hypothetical protein
MKIIKWIIKDLKLASKEDWFYVALGIPVSVYIREKENENRYY